MEVIYSTFDELPETIRDIEWLLKEQRSRT